MSRLSERLPFNQFGSSLISALIAVAVLSVAMMLIVRSFPILFSQARQIQTKNDLRSLMSSKISIIESAVNRKGSLKSFLIAQMNTTSQVNPVITINLNNPITFATVFGAPISSKVSLDQGSFVVSYKLTLSRVLPDHSSIPIVIGTDRLSDVSFLLIVVEMQGMIFQNNAPATLNLESIISVQNGNSDHSILAANIFTGLWL